MVGGRRKASSPGSSGGRGSEDLAPHAPSPHPSPGLQPLNSVLGSTLASAALCPQDDSLCLGTLFLWTGADVLYGGGSSCGMGVESLWLWPWPCGSIAGFYYGTWNKLSTPELSPYSWKESIIPTFFAWLSTVGTPKYSLEVRRRFPLGKLWLGFQIKEC